MAPTFLHRLLASSPLAGWFTLTCVLVGCADNAVLDVELQVPPSAEYTQLELEVRPASTNDFSAPWAPTDRFPIATYELNSATPAEVNLSIVAEDVSESVLLQVRFCRAEGCDPSSPTLCYAIDRPFHGGAVSRFRSTVGGIPGLRAPDAACSLDPRPVARCEIGCVDGRFNDATPPPFCVDPLDPESEHVCDS